MAEAAGAAPADAVRPSVVAVVGSPRTRSNTAALVAAALEELESAGASCETIVLSRLSIEPCFAHDLCADLPRCPLEDDTPAALDKVYAADCLVLGSPVYYENVSAQMKAFIDRNLFPFSKGERLRARAVGLVAVTAETGLQDALDALRRYVGLSTQGDVKVLTCGAYADEAGTLAADDAALGEARRLGRALAEELGLTPA
jgi:multimeric flavodoxin WrbA